MAISRGAAALTWGAVAVVLVACTTQSMEEDRDTLAVVGDSPAPQLPASPNVGTPAAQPPSPAEPGRQPPATPPAGAPPRTPPAPSAGEVTLEELAQMKARARELARREGCDTEARCATAPMGAKPCGGPQAYLVYCATATDTAALFALLERIRQAERSLNERLGRISDCLLVTPPEVELVGGACRAAGAGGTR